MTTDPFTTYRAEIDALLTGLDPATRRDILAGIDEHLQAETAALGHDPSPHEAQAIVDRLGSPRDIAEEASVRASLTQSAPRHFLAAPWLPPVLVMFQLAGIAVSFMVVPALGAVAALVIGCLCPLYARHEKITGTVATIAGMAGSLMWFATFALTGMDGCYDYATGEGIDPDTGRPLYSGIPECSEIYGAGDLAVGYTGVALSALAALVVVAIAVRVTRRALAPHDAARPRVAPATR